MRTLTLLLCPWTALMLVAAWAGTVLWLAPLPLAARITLIPLYLAASLLPPLFWPGRWHSLIVPVVLLTGVLACFFTRVPPNHRHWQDHPAPPARPRRRFPTACRPARAPSPNWPMARCCFPCVTNPAPACGHGRAGTGATTC